MDRFLDLGRGAAAAGDALALRGFLQADRLHGLRIVAILRNHLVFGALQRLVELPACADCNVARGGLRFLGAQLGFLGALHRFFQREQRLDAVLAVDRRVVAQVLQRQQRILVGFDHVR